MSSYSRVHYEDRLKIEVLLKAGHGVCEIGRLIGKHHSTISREIKRGQYVHRNSDWTEEVRYSPELAEERYQNQLKEKGPDIKLGKDFELAEYLETTIRDKKYSPYAALQKIKQEGKQFKVSICKGTVYSYIDKGFFLTLTNKDLPVKGNKKKEYKKIKRRKRCSAGESIEKRPKEIMTRKEFGHWEMDTVVGKQGGSKKSLLVLTERKTRKEIIEVLQVHTAEAVVNTLNKIKRKFGASFKKIFKTITVDNGSEFADANGMQKTRRGKSFRTKVFYCHPYCSSERGSNENQNKLIRRHIPKGVDIKLYSKRTIKEIEEWVNNYPREMFGGRCAEELFQEELLKI